MTLFIEFCDSDYGYCRIATRIAGDGRVRTVALVTFTGTPGQREADFKALRDALEVSNSAAPDLFEAVGLPPTPFPELGFRDAVTCKAEGAL